MLIKLVTFYFFFVRYTLLRSRNNLSKLSFFVFVCHLIFKATTDKLRSFDLSPASIINEAASNTSNATTTAAAA